MNHDLKSTKWRIKQICDAIGRYYEYCGHPYDSYFSTYCDNSGIDADGIEAELNEDPKDAVLVDFDDNFPFKDNPPHDKAKFIHDLIRKCRAYPDITFLLTIPQFDKIGATLFKKLDLADIKQTYRKQCPVLWSSEWAGDKGLLMILAAGKKYKFEYLMHLVDDFGRYRIQNMFHNIKKDTVTDWSSSHKHFRQMQNVSVDIKKHNKIRSITYRELATNAVNSFSKRVCPNLQLKSMQSIDDSLEDTVEYINDAVLFVSGLIKNAEKLNREICPFQIDFAIASAQPFTDEMVIAKSIDKNDYEDDDDDEEAKRYVDRDVDCVDNVQIKLEDHGLKYILNTKDYEKENAKDGRVFENLYENLLKQHQLESKTEGFGYLYKKRLITLIDRRDKNKNYEKQNDMWMYEPPFIKESDCQNIPDNAVPEWYINSSLACILPSRKSKEEKEDTKTEKKEELKRANIGAKDHCKGSLLTLSFHVKQKNMMKCYLYWNGGIIRFMPKDIKTVLPAIFNMKYHGNKAYIEDKSGDLAVLIDDLKGKLVDDEFSQFVNSYN